MTRGPVLVTLVIAGALSAAYEAYAGVRASSTVAMDAKNATFIANLQCTQNP